MSKRPEVLFVCVHNAGRSQIAAAWSSSEREVGSGCTRPELTLDVINPAVIEAMAELGVDMAQEAPKPITDEAVRAADVVITIGCGDDGPVVPGQAIEEWIVDDPAGQNLQAVRRIRDEIDRRVQLLVGKPTA